MKKIHLFNFPIPCSRKPDRVRIVVLMLLLVTLVSLRLHAQSGDEDPDMFNKAKARDQQAIDEAVKGWWTASMKNHEQRIGWWRDAKFGMFVHWGIYSLPGGEWKGRKVPGYGEHLMRKEKITRSEYIDLAHQFNPVSFNADAWIRRAKDAGMKYFVITSKHHDGFAMYDSNVSGFNIMEQTPFRRDPMAELAAACKTHDVKFGFYYSHAFDWEHPDAPGNDWEFQNPGGDLNLYGGRNWYDAHPELLPTAVKYVNEKAIPQIKELIQKYQPDILWFDTPHKLPLSENIRILKAIREMDDNIVVNGRLARSATVSFGDYRNTADRPAEFYPVEGDWEAIPTTNESYGYHKYDTNHKSPEFFIRLMAKAAARGGNLLMNIGPKGDGTFDAKDLDILSTIGKWMRVYGESIYGTSASPLPLQSWGEVTRKQNTLYLHVFHKPEDGKLILCGLKSRTLKAHLLADASKKALRVRRLNTQDVVIDLSGKSLDPVNAVIVLEMEGGMETGSVRRLTGANLTQRLLAFDAEQHGKGFRYGDGKKDRYYVEGWHRTDQSLSWTFRIDAPATFLTRLKYIAVRDGGGQARIKLNDKIVFDRIAINEKQNGLVDKDVGLLSLQPGTYTVDMIPLTIEGPEIMKLLEVDLVPVASGK